MRIGNRSLTELGSPYIIAEIGVNHDGSESRARQLVDQAAASGANAVKFQFFTADRLLSRGSKLAQYQREAGASDAHGMLQPLELSLEVLARLVEHARKINIHPIVTIFSIEHVQEVSQLPWAAFKTASPDIINKPLVDALCALDKPLIVSTGAATLDEVEQAINWLGSCDYALMQCVSAYPTPMESAQLASIAALRERCEAPVGYSDHTIEELTGALAVAAGAKLLEKHLTYDRSAAGLDHAMSLDPAAFKRYVQAARQAAIALGKPGKTVQDIERDVRDVARQSIVTTRALKAGAIIRREDLTVKRPAGGLPPAMLCELIGNPILADIAADMPLTADHVGLKTGKPTRRPLASRAA